MKNILVIVRKEMRRVLSDRRVLASLILPGILIYVLYTLMGTMLTDAFGEEENYRYSVAVYNMPQSLSDSFDSLPVTLSFPAGEEALQAAQEQVRTEELDLLVVFPADFDQQVDAYQPGSGQEAPRVEFYASTASTSSSSAYQLIVGVLDAYESTLANKFDCAMNDLATPEQISSMVFSMMMPMLLIIFLFTGAMSLVPDALAGEKERGTIATLLVTPVPRSHIAIGKILSLSLLSMIGGLSSFLGTMLALPRLMDVGSELDTAIYGGAEYLALLLIILSTLLLIVSIIAVIATFANTVKEATAYIMPLMIVVMVLAVFSMASPGTQPTAVYLIPLYNSARALGAVFSLSYSPVSIALTVISNLLVSALCTFALTRMFNSERVMFKK